MYDLTQLCLLQGFYPSEKTYSEIDTIRQCRRAIIAILSVIGDQSKLKTAKLSY